MTDRMRVLLVEDDEDDYLLTRDQLADIPGGRWEVTWAATYKDGIDTLGKAEWHAILVDFHLGERDGIEFVRDAQARGCAAPILILTGQGDHEVDHAAMRAGAMDYLEKGQISGPLLERSLRYAVERAKVLRSLHELSIHDELTGLYNRREFDRLLAEEIARSKRTGRPLSLIMMDVDKFKAINDTHGHQAGDRILQHVAHILRAQVRVIDRVARYGGDEFAVILPETGGKGALNLANRLAQAFSKHPYRGNEGKDGRRDVPVTLSLGVAEYPSNAADAARLVEYSDRALYISKNKGGGQAAICPEKPAEPAK